MITELSIGLSIGAIVALVASGIDTSTVIGIIINLGLITVNVSLIRWNKKFFGD